MPQVRLFAPAHAPQTELWMQAYEELGHDVETISVPRPITGHQLGPFLRQFVRARNTRRSADVTVIHSLGAHGLLALLVGTHGAVTSVPWGSEVFRATGGGLRSAVARRLLRLSDHVIVTSREMANLLRSTWAPEVAEKIRVISWGIDAALFARHRSESEIRSIRRRWGYGDEDVVIVAPRGTKSVYRHSDVLKGFEAARRQRRQLKLVVVGHQSTQERGALDGVPGAVTYAGWQPKPQLAELFAAANAIVSVPVHDQRSTAVLEAIASGARVLVSDLPPYAELITDGAHLDVLAEPLADSLARALLEIPAEPHARNRQNQAWARERESAKTQMAKIVEVTCEA